MGAFGVCGCVCNNAAMSSRGIHAEVSSSCALALVSVGVSRGRTLHDVTVGGDNVWVLPAIAVCVSGCLLPTE